MIANINAVVQRIDTYLTVLRLSGNYAERQRINLSNQALPAFCEEARAEVLSAVAKGVLAEAFMAHMEAQRPTPGKPLPRQFEEFVNRQLAVAQSQPGPPTTATPIAARSGQEAHAT